MTTNVTSVITGSQYDSRLTINMKRHAQNVIVKLNEDSVRQPSYSRGAAFMSTIMVASQLLQVEKVNPSQKIHRTNLHQIVLNLMAGTSTPTNSSSLEIV